MENEGIPIEEVHRLHASHLDIFRGAIEEREPEISYPENQPGHPIHTFKLENSEINTLIESKLKIHLEQFAVEQVPDTIYCLLEDLNLLLGY